MSVQNIFSPKATRIVRVLLVSPQKDWSILSLSEEAGTAYSHAYRLVKTLLKLGLCRKTETNRVKVANSVELLSRWAAYHDFNLLNEAKAYYSMERDLDSLLRKLSSASKDDLKYALTLHVGASLVAPYVRPASLHFYMKNEEKRWVERLGLQPTELGGNVYLAKPYDEGVFYGVQEVRGVWVVSNVQLYVDLYNYPARGREAAEHLRKEMLGF
ncbi:MAG: type IV toxin-antitoxin system AbiEi family antitoxin [Candidatus Bathyarchaeia archaeon]